MKLSEVSADNISVKEYLRISDDDEATTISTIMKAAKSFVLSYTGLTIEQADEHEELAIAFLCLCSDMFDSRQMTVQNDKLNPTVDIILRMHSVNYL